MSLQSRLVAVPDDAQSHDLFNLLDEKQTGKLIECLDDGFVRLVRYMADDADVVQAARVSYGAGTETASDNRRQFTRNHQRAPDHRTRHHVGQDARRERSRDGAGWRRGQKNAPVDPGCGPRRTARPL